MDLILYALSFTAGGLLTYLLLPKSSPFEKSIWTNLYAGKRVILSIDDDAYIFEMQDNRVRITRATAELLSGEGEDNVFDQLVPSDMADVQSAESDSTDDSGC